jgi:hypothetical protein
MKEDRKEFLRGLARLTKRYGFVIGGCGWDPKTETYSLGGA